LAASITAQKSTTGKHGNVICILLVIIVWKTPDILPRAELCRFQYEIEDGAHADVAERHASQVELSP
jgi:hypothetical protein